MEYMRRLIRDIKFEVFFDMSKAFDKVWYEGLIFKLKQNGISDKLLRLTKDFLSDRKQRVVLNGQCSSSMDVQAGVPQGSIYNWTFIFLIYIDDLSDNLTSNPKLFADNKSIFSTIADPNAMANQINNDLHHTDTWAYQWKMNFNPDTSKQAQEFIFCRKVKLTAHPQLVCNNNPVHETSTQKHLGMILDFKLDFQEHFENILNKVNKTIGLLQKLQNTLP